MEDEGAREEAAGEAREGGGGARQGEERQPEEASVCPQGPRRVPESG